MKSYLKEKEELKKTLPFPKLMQAVSTEEIILAVKKNSESTIQGIIINSGKSVHEVGYFSESWVSNCFIDCDEQVVLQND